MNLLTISTLFSSKLALTGGNMEIFTEIWMPLVLAPVMIVSFIMMTF